MSEKPYKNMAASVRQRLLNRARSDGRPFSELLQYFVMERFLYRLSLSPHVDKFILKGALMLRAWGSPQFRPTKDIDVLGKTDNEESSVIGQIRDVLVTDVEPDGIVFYADSIQAERITEDADYEGIRIRFQGALGSARVSMQIDIGFGDVVFPKPKEAEFPSLLDFPVPRLYCYSRESAIAEKFEAMVKLGELNSRMKDFYDIWLLSRQFDFTASNLSEAIRLTLGRRGTLLPEEIVAFADGFGAAKQPQWTAFRRKIQQDQVPASFADIVSDIRHFLAPLLSGLLLGHLFEARWTASGHWVKNPQKS